MKIRFACLALLVLFVSWSLQAIGQPAKQGQPGVKADPRDLVFLGGSRPLLIRLDIRMHGKPLQAAWDEFIDYLFKYADLDGDGVLSKEEAEAAPQPSTLLNNFGFVGFGPMSGAGKMDANGDGKVTRAEFADYYRQSGLPPFQVQLEASKNNRRNGFMPFMKKTPPTSQLNAALLKLLDTNNDGKLSREELKAAEAILLKLDSDEDEVVTPQELLPDFSPLSLGFDARQTFSEVAGPTSGPNNDPLFLASTEQPREIARRLLTRYGLDKTKKGLTREQLNLDAATFAALDRDGNGELDAEELARFAARSPDLEFVVRVGDRNAREAAVELLTRKGSKVSVKARMAGEALVLVLGGNRLALRVGEAPGRSQLSVIIREQYRQQFRQADRDNNGYVDEKEARMSGFMAGNVFKMMDRDGDGKVYEKELMAYVDKVEEMQSRATTSCVTLTFADNGRSLFELFDSDRDGRLSLRELKQLPRLVDEVGKGGAIAPEDIPLSYLFSLEQGSGGGGPNPYAVFEAMGINAERPAAKGRGPLWFQKMDRNRDGDVSRREWLGSEALFRRIDTDGDGLISLEEALRYEETLKQGKQLR